MKINVTIQWRNAITWDDRVSRIFGTGWITRRGIGEAILFSAALLLLTGCSFSGRATQPKETTPATTSPSPQVVELPLNQEVVVTGEVTANISDALDAPRWLYLGTDKGEIRVDYDYGEFPPCINKEARRAGREMKEGDEIEVFGIVTDRARISVCDSPDYYLLKR